jgi:uncharacterized protein YdhG (YjbR/CyaY superfamily)
MTVIDEYLESLDAPHKQALSHVCDIVRAQVPDVTEAIGYGMPVFKYKGKYLIGLSKFANHMSVFPGSGPVVALGRQLDGYKTSKGTIQFTVDKPLTDELLRSIIDYCVKSIDRQ